MMNSKQWFDTIVQSYERPPVLHAGRELPAFPSDTIQSNTTGQAGKATLKEAFVFYEDCIDTFSRLGRPVQSSSTLLDFGVGWGRIARFFLREIPLENVHGLDVTEEFVQICKETFRSPNFHTNAPFPPTSLAAGSFDFVVGYSVFSHLSEQACQQWMQEFHRITKPGAIVALTTRGRPFFDYCESLKGKGLGGYADALGSMFEDFNLARARYDRGEFVHANSHGVTGNGAMTKDFYGETFIPEQYARAAYTSHFTLERFMYVQARQSHPIMFFRRK